MSDSAIFCIEDNPTSQSIMLGGRYINLSALARTIEADQSYLSRILSGKRNPGVDLFSKIADALGTTMDQLRSDIQDRVDVESKVA